MYDRHMRHVLYLWWHRVLYCWHKNWLFEGFFSVQDQQQFVNFKNSLIESQFNENYSFFHAIFTFMLSSIKLKDIILIFFDHLLQRWALNFYLLPSSVNFDETFNDIVELLLKITLEHEMIIFITTRNTPKCLQIIVVYL